MSNSTTEILQEIEDLQNRLISLKTDANSDEIDENIDRCGKLLNITDLERSLNTIRNNLTDILATTKLLDFQKKIVDWANRNTFCSKLSAVHINPNVDKEARLAVDSSVLAIFPYFQPDSVCQYSIHIGYFGTQTLMIAMSEISNGFDPTENNKCFIFDCARIYPIFENNNFNFVNLIMASNYMQTTPEKIILVLRYIWHFADINHFLPEIEFEFKKPIVILETANCSFLPEHDFADE